MELHRARLGKSVEKARFFMVFQWNSNGIQIIRQIHEDPRSFPKVNEARGNNASMSFRGDRVVSVNKIESPWNDGNVMKLDIS